MQSARWFVYGASVLFLTAVLAGCGEEVKEEDYPDVQLGINLLKNSSFEEWQGQVPKDWTLQHFEGEGDEISMYGRSAKEKVSGRYSFYLRGLFSTEKWMVLTQRHPVIPEYRVTISAEMMSLNIKRNKDQQDRANIFVRFYDEKGERVNDRYYADGYTHRRTGTTRWHRNTERIVVPRKARWAEIGLINQMTGHLYFDDVTMILEKPWPWKKKETDNVIFYYFDDAPFPDGAIERTAARIDGYVEKLDIEMPKKIEYYNYGTEEHFIEVTRRKKYKQQPFWEKKELHTIDPEEQDEIIHLMLAHLGYPPLGMARGLNYALRGTIEGEDIHLKAKPMLWNRQVPALHRTLSQKNLEEFGYGLMIPAWTSFVKYLIDEFGPRKFMELYRQVNDVEEPGPFNVHFKDIYGKDFDEADREWRLYVLRIEDPVPDEPAGGDTAP